MCGTKVSLLAVAVLVLAVPAAGGAPAQTRSTKKLIVGTKHAPPFAMKNPDGTWSGLSIDLWRQIAAELGLP